MFHVERMTEDFTEQVVPRSHPQRLVMSPELVVAHYVVSRRGVGSIG